ncbi:hypothetical protein [Novosphingopyxis sp.]|uniref:hypothetical protein n=1 Tax=Novosphingopyxis sp. TaxID=2709690 RepID=UPI003B5903C8
MERVTFDIERPEVAKALHAIADVRGRSIQDELSALVEKTYAPKTRTDPEGPSDNWVRELIAIARTIDLPDGLDPYLPERRAEDYTPIKL